MRGKNSTLSSCILPVTKPTVLVVKALSALYISFNRVLYPRKECIPTRLKGPVKDSDLSLATIRQDKLDKMWETEPADCSLFSTPGDETGMVNLSPLASVDIVSACVFH